MDLPDNPKSSPPKPETAFVYPRRHPNILKTKYIFIHILFLKIHGLMAHRTIFLWGEFTGKSLRFWLRKRKVTSRQSEFNPIEVGV